MCTFLGVGYWAPLRAVRGSGAPGVRARGTFVGAGIPDAFDSLPTLGGLMCAVLDDLAAAVHAVPGLPCPAGLGTADVLAEQVAVLSGAVAVLQRELGLRMAALAEQDHAVDVRGDAVRAGMAGSQAARLRRLGGFAREHPALAEAWAAGAVGEDQVAALRDGAAQLPPRLREELVQRVLPHLPVLDARGARALVAYTADLLDPADPDHGEQSDYAARHLVWTAAPGGGLAFEGYLPAAEAAAFTAAIEALAQEVRVAGDGLSAGQRRADALAALAARAAAQGLPTGGGLPAALTVTVSLTEAARVARRDPAAFGADFRGRPRSGAVAGQHPAGDAAVRFGLCCAAVTPVLAEEPEPGSLLDRIARTRAEPLGGGAAGHPFAAAGAAAARRRLRDPRLRGGRAVHAAAPRDRLVGGRGDRLGQPGQPVLGAPPADRARPLRLPPQTARPGSTRPRPGPPPMVDPTTPPRTPRLTPPHRPPGHPAGRDGMRRTSGHRAPKCWGLVRCTQ